MFCGHISNPNQRLECTQRLELRDLPRNFHTIDIYNTQYHSALKEFGQELYNISVEYYDWEKNEYLPKIRRQPENTDQRRFIEVKHFTDEERKQFDEIKKDINEQYREQFNELPWGVSFWENTIGLFSSEKSSKQLLKEKFSKKLTIAVEEYVDSISAKKQAEYEEKNKDKYQAKIKTIIVLRKAVEKYNAMKDKQEVESNDTEKIVAARTAYLDQMGIDSHEFNTFTGNTPEQNKLHRSITKVIDHANIIDGDVPEHVRQMYNNLLKTSYDLNKANYTDLAQELFELCDIFSLITAFGEEIADTVQHPLSYLQRRFGDMFSRTTPLDELDEYDEQELRSTVKEIVAETNKIVSENEAHYDPELKALQRELRKLAVHERHRMFARSSIDFLLDFLLIAATQHAFNITGVNKALSDYRLNNYRNKQLKGKSFTTTAGPTTSHLDSPIPQEALIEEASAKVHPAFIAKAASAEIESIGLIEKEAEATAKTESEASQSLPITEKEKKINHSLSKENFKAHTVVFEDGMHKIVETTFSSEEALDILNNSKELRQLNECVGELKTKIGDARPGLVEDRYDASQQYLKACEEAEIFYERIRATTEDIERIVKNTNIPKPIIEQIKKHVFYDKHIIDEGILLEKRFPADLDMKEAWQRLIDGNFLQADLLLLQHEYAEFLIMRGSVIDYHTAHHKIINSIYQWQKYIQK